MNFNTNDFEWVPVAQVRSKREAYELELVLIAVGIKTEVARSLWGWRLMTPSSQENLAKSQLRLYRSENIPEPPKQDPVMFKVHWIGIAAYLGVLWTFFVFDLLTFNQIFRFGTLVAGDVYDGYWWLTITALTLHGGFQHILGNSIFGAIVGWVSCRYFGSGFAWLLILLSGALGNALNALVQVDTFAAIGASTANFGAVGLICGFVANRRFTKGRSLTFNYAPVIAGIGVFLLFGIGTENTDVVGHFMGLIAGLGLGFLTGYIDPHSLGRTGQRIAGLLAIGILLLAWTYVWL